MHNLTVLSLVLATVQVACDQSQASLDFSERLPTIKTVTTDQPNRSCIKITDLPQPYDSRSASQPPQIIARPKDAQLLVPQGFQVSIFADG